MTEPRQFVGPVDVSIGGATVTLEPLRGLKNIRAFEAVVVEEVRSLQARVEKYAREGRNVSPEALLETGVDIERLLKCGAPGAITPKVLANAAIRELFGALEVVLTLNNLSRFQPFLLPEMLLELGTRLAQMTQFPVLPMPESNGSSSESAAVGATSSES
ncbi:MAG TPA: hypothetical protein VGU71_22575 [Candidatus Dormibacteraeota bacterium]|nr:hypothetical protein [Candidatus Dormibacteraeota bacterium]